MADLTVPEKQFDEAYFASNACVKRDVVDFLQKYVKNSLLKEHNMNGAAKSVAKNRKKPQLEEVYNKVYAEAPAWWKTSEDVEAEAAEAAAEAAAAAEAEIARKAKAKAAAEARQAKLDALKAERMAGSNAAKGNADRGGSGAGRIRGRQGGKVKPLKQKKARAKVMTEEDEEFQRKRREDAARLKAARAKAKK
ncbi:uncharacterized protein AMSG_08545 [Thecamonas trahens ATCC 50062]|uniref:FKBP3 basic tilted helix bundle domain-containing protein n=1 Tax=Thecamonas trahens ATCC 50062 TaxID=461836 RepID=A0A0L0DK62_THETB|nr:hypothetical protein AMSG_08545 [Thecamonas trahens ATCC 50062]KNC52672.1 hypothetical protein AMSG_08545 [Thecamonas trahens ATCC 50062]|eukprot:XP_013755221.1 hypothetical protein AMSG_08545 [Thecamonas trahens ATCC 50062]